VLDLGCGPGLFARAAADRGARVTGIDVDPTAVRSAATEVPEASFAVGDARNPPPGQFDVAAAVQLLMHVGDPLAVLAAAAEAAPVVVATVWGRPQECDLRVFGEALAPWLRQPQPRPAAVTDPGRLRALAQRAGLVVERLDQVTCCFRYADEADVLRPLAASGLMRALRGRAAPAAVRAALLDRLQPYRCSDGGFELHNTFRILVARPA
jgi:SAM-dependent methyltransferase